MLTFNTEFGYFQFYKQNNRSLKLLNESSSFDLLKNYHDLNDLNKKNITALYDEFRSLFSKYKMNVIFHGSTFIKNKLSRLLFKENNINELYFSKFANTSLRKHFVEFNCDDDLFDYTDLIENKTIIGSNKTKVKLNSQVKLLYLWDIYNVDLSESLVDKYVYKRIEYFCVFGSFLSINDFTFKSLQHLYDIRFLIRNPREFWHNSADHKWLMHINSRQAHNFTIQNQTKITDDIIKWYKMKFGLLSLTDYFLDYDYPNEDMCLFRNFPHKNTILFYLFPIDFWGQNAVDKNIFNVRTCTMFHLTRYSFLFKHLKINGIFFSRFVYDQSLFQECDLDALLRNCSFKNDSFYSRKIIEINLDDFIYSLDWIELIGPILTFPIVSLIGIITNILVILTIKLKRNKDFFTKTDNQTRMFDYLVINSTFNIVECAISCFTLMSECLGLETIYCSRIQMYEEVQYFKIYFVGYFGEIMKTCSVIFTLLFSMERYKITVESQNAILVKLSRFKLKTIITLTILISAATSFGKIFENNVDGVYLSQIEFPPLNFFDLFRANKWFQIVCYIFHYVINDFFLYAFNLIVDILLVRKIRGDLKFKKTFLKENFNKNCNQNSVLLKKFNDGLNEIAKAERGTNKLLIYSFFVYTFCRFPELCFYLYILLADKSQQFIMHTLGPLTINVVEYLYIVSYSFNLFFYFKFNKNFRDAFKNLFGKSH